MMNCCTGRLKFACILVCTLLVAIPLLAQLPTGTILGVVKDTTGAAIPDATITISNIETNETRTVRTGNDGAYRAAALQPGRYSLKVEKTGFTPQTQTPLTLEVAQQLVVNATLQVGSSSQEVTVSAEESMVNTTTSDLGGLVNDAKIADLPLNGRNFVDLALLQPGVTNNTAYSNGGNLGLWFSVNGAPTRSNNTTLDGAPMTNIRGTTAGAIGTTLGVDGIKEYRVITGGFGAEYGLTMGSQVVVVSKGGTNVFHGDVFEYLRNSALDARNYFDHTDADPLNPRRLPEFQRNNFGGSFGGPIQKDKTFFYGVYEGLRQNLGQSFVDNVFPANCHVAINNPCAVSKSNPTGAVAPVMLPILDLYPLPNLGTSQFAYNPVDPSHVNYGQIRVDHNFSEADSLFGRYTIQESGTTQHGAYPQVTTGIDGRDQFITLSENHVFSPVLLNTARFSFSRTNIFQGPGDGTVDLSGPQYAFIPGQPMGNIQGGGLTNFAGGVNLQGLLQNLFTLSDDVFYTRGRHAFKFGVLANRFENYDTDTTNARGTLMFSSRANFLAGHAASEGGVTPGSDENRETRFYTLGLYAQDDFRVNSRLTLNLGLRYEITTVPFDRLGRNSAIVDIVHDTAPTLGVVFRNPSYHNFGPRVGFAWDVFGNGKTSIRSSFGEYYDIANEGYSIFSAAQGTPPFSSQSSFVPSPNAVLTLPFSFPAGSVGNALHTQQYFIHSPHLLQWSLSVQQQLTGNTALTLAYVGTRGIHLWNSMEGNPCMPTSIDSNGIPFWAQDCGNGRRNPAWGAANYETTDSDSWYNGFQALLNKRVSHGVELQGSYTFAKVIDDFQGQQGAAECTTAGGANGLYPLDPKRFDRGSSCFDVKHTLRTSILYHLPSLNSGNSFFKGLLSGWWTGNIIAWRTGFYFTPMLSSYRSRSNHLIGFGGTAETDRASIGTATVAPGQVGPGGFVNTTNVTFIPYDKDKVIIGKPEQWFNPLMFTPGPVGFLGTAGRNMLEGPHMTTWDFSINKDTHLPFLGEAGKLAFRAEFFNILNHANFQVPNSAGNGGLVYSGAVNDVNPFSEAPLASAGVIDDTVTTSRQIQFSLRIEF